VKKDYSIVTELPNTKIPIEQLERFYQRYKFAQKFTYNKRVLEIACGGGQGLNLLAHDAVSVRGIDIEKKNLNIAKAAYKNHSKISIEYHDANQLHFTERSFDLIILFEAIYYLHDAPNVIRKCKDILSDNGIIIIESVNKEWKDFNPSPYAHLYYSTREIYDMLKSVKFKKVDMFCSYKTGNKTGVKARSISYLKRLSVKLNLMPKSMKYKTFLKRIFFGKMTLLPPILNDNICNYTEPEQVDPENYDTQFKVIYAVGYKS